MQCLPQAEIPIAQALCRVLADHGKQCYLVGGSVRDFLLGAPIHDIDLTTDAHPDEMLRIFTEAGYKVIPTGIQHGTVTVLFDKTPVEITTYRKDAEYTDHRHPDRVTFTPTLKEDLKRRDFTINAMALDPLALDPTTKEWHVVDLFGGRRDIQNKIITAVGNPNDRFAEDPLRMFRACRFSAKLGFTIADKTAKAMAKNKTLVKHLSMERIRDELLKVLATPTPSVGVDCFVQHGLVDQVLPELKALVYLQQNPKYHEFDAYTHTLHVIDNLPADKPLVRLAGLFHDIGKPLTKQETETGTHFIGHEEVSATLFDAIADRLKLSNTETNYAKNLIAHHMIHYTPHDSNSAIRRIVGKVGEDAFPDLLLLRDADYQAGIKVGNPTSDLRDRYLAMKQQHIPTQVTLKDLAVDGHDVMQVLNIPPSPAVGKALTCLLEEVIENPSLNTRDQLLDRLKALPI